VSARGSFYVESLGCAKNQVDSELMIARLQDAGWVWSETPEGADVLIVNTCGFISEAKKESIETSLGFRARFPGKKVYMVGCLSERYGAELAAEMPEIDGFAGNREPSSVVELLDGTAGGARGDAGRAGGEAARAGRGEPPARHYERPRLLSYPGSAYVKVAEGCSNRCTYCAIPLIRGDLRSRGPREVREEIRGLLARGVREIVLIAQDLGSYGADLGAAALPDLLSGISELPGDFWVRLLYIHPDRFPAAILPVLGRDPRILPYFDLPFQHASPRILTAMGRVGDPEKNLALIQRIRGTLPGAVIRSTFLVGFPGETEEELAHLLDFQARAALDWLGVFTYSREEDTPAYSLPGRVPARTARARKALLEERQVPVTERALDAHVGRVLDVLVEEPVAGEEMSIGRAYLQAPDVDGLTVVRAACAPGDVVRVRITRRNGLDLEGEPLAGPGPGGARG
jgi:ribosomal protein S12 methylthiotransferase